MKHNLLKSVIISVILLMGVSNAWAYDVKSPHVYFNATNVSLWPGVNIVVGHDSYSFGDLMSKVSDTNLYYAKVTFNGSDANGFVFIGANSKWGAWNNQSLYDRTQGQSNRTDYLWFYNTITGGLPSGTYYFSTSGNKKAIDYSQYTTIPTFNTTSAVRVRTGTSGTYSNASGTYPADISIQGTYISGDGKTNRTSITSTKSSDGEDNKVYGSVITGLVTLSYSNLNEEAYTFDGWGTSDSKVSSTSTNYEFNQSANTTVYAFFTKKTYTITYKQGANGSGSIDAGTKEHGVNYTLSSNKFTRTGYTQTGWSTSDGGAKVYDLGGTYTANTDVTLYPFWTLAEYTIKYDNLKGATHTNPATYTINSATITFTAPTSKPAGYTFANWSPASIDTGSTGDKTVTANWTAATSTVEFNQEEATEKGTASVTATYGSAMPAITKLPIRTGYTFGGYYTGKNGAGTQYYKADGTSATTWNLEGAQTLYAKWAPITYSVKFNGNGSTSGSMSNQSFTYDEAAKALTTNAFKKTGYTFAGWNTAENGSGISYADKATVRNLTTTNNATINLYAKWTINQYTLTYSAGEGGSVTGDKASGAKYDYNTSITLTATPSAGNVFVEWVNESGTMVSTANPYTFDLTANKTIKAEFAPPTTVYLKPEGYWPDASARFAIYTWGAGKTERWVEMQHVDCENQYYSANIPSGYTNFKYIRLNPAGKDDASKNDGLHWDYKWGETGDLTLQGEDKNLYVTQRIYFKPHANWTQAKARFAAYFFVDGDGEKVKWMSMFKDGDIYWCNIPNEHSYNRVIFARMNPDNEVNSFDDGTKWNQTGDLTLSQSNLYTLTGGEWNNVTGSWSTHWETFSTPTYPLTLKATPYGEYTVNCNGVSHTSSRTKDIVINLPVGATVEITTAESYDAAYNSDLVIKTSSNSQYEAAKLNTTYTFCGETTIEENFTTTADHVVYLRVATSGDAIQWNENGNKNYIYCTNRLTNEVVEMTAVAADDNSEINQETGYNYFKATVRAGYRAFRFERATNKTEYFEHLLPLGQSNCFTIKGKNTSLGTFYGDWILGTAEGDYRILYVEQQVDHGTDENDWKTVINTTYQHASDIIKKGDGATIVSLHIKYDKTKHPEVILQKFTGGKWVDVEGQAHMVLGPLTASADMAMLPGRRNVEGDVNLRYGDGIEEIKADAETGIEGIEGRVWNFVVQQSDASAYINFNTNDFAPYKGDYYIRTDNAAGGWMPYAIPGNMMSHSDYSLVHSGYSHYFCKWVDKKDQNDPEDKTYTPNVKFVVANKYGAAISDTIASDDFTDTNGTLEADANVRWMWNEYTNVGSRAYIAGSKENDFLKVFYAEKSKKFEDNGEWVYEIDLTDVQVGDILTSILAHYDNQDQELLEQSYIEKGGLEMLTSTGGARTTHTVRVIYDFKINETLIYLVPTEIDVTTPIDVIIERINQDEAGEATQVRAAITPANAEGLTVYGLITLTQDHITDPNKSEQEALTYWISFPFDVKIGDITGFGEVGKHWMIKYYDGAERAAKGWFLDTKTFWKFFTNTEDVMKANTGYVLTLNKNLLNESNSVYDNTDVLKLYFPSKEKITTEINGELTTTTVDVPEHWCNIERPCDRTTADSHWNLIGVPSYANQNITTDTKSVKYFYNYSHKDDTYNVAVNGGAKTFQPMHAYMVQFGGTIDWKNSTFTEGERPQLAAKKNADAEEQYTLRLELQQNGKKVDQTFVELQDDATAMFDMNVDLTKMFNASANIYTLIDSDNQVAANVMPIANTVIPVGVQVATAGEYTFAMPDGTDGVVVELIDYEANVTTNLLLSDYTVNLPAGANETRFALSVKPNKTATSVDNISGATGDEAKKYIIDGVLYLQRDGALYDAQGHIVR